MRILVILSDQHRKLGAESLLLRKAAMLAEGLGASLELLRVIYDRTIEVSMFLKADRLESAREGILAHERDWVASVAESLRSKGLSVGFDVRWDHPRADAIVRKVEEDGFDWVLKEPGDDRYLLGLFSNTDWELLRDSPVGVYFVKGANPPGAGVLVALEGLIGGEGSREAVLDYEIFRQGRRIGDTFDTPLVVVHAYQVPASLPAYIGYAPLFGDSTVSPEVFRVLTEAERQEREEVAQRHGQAITACAEHFNYPVADIVLREGPPDTVISDEAHRRQSGLVVMGAGEGNLLDRLFRKVTAEPTLAEADCDILFVKPASRRASEGSRARPEIQRMRCESNDSRELSGILANPSARFVSPSAVVDDEGHSVYDKRRILRAWEDNLLRVMPSDDANQTSPEALELEAVRAAQRALRHRRSNPAGNHRQGAGLKRAARHR